MDANERNELYSIKTELNSIIAELESISAGVRNGFVGVGSEKCADCIDDVICRYYNTRRQLNNLDTSSVLDGFA